VLGKRLNEPRVATTHAVVFLPKKISVSTHAVAAALRQARGIVLGQLSVTALLAGVSAAVWGIRAAVAVLIGGGIGIVAAGYLLIAMIRSSARVTGRPNLVGLLLAWVVKTTLTVSLLLIALRSKALPPPALLAGFGGSLLGYWLSLSLGRTENVARSDGE